MAERSPALRSFLIAAMLVATPAACVPARAQQPPPAMAERIEADATTGVVGKMVAGPDGEPIGRIVDVLVDASGVPKAAVLDFGGFMGVGQRRIAVAWRALQFVPDAAGAKLRLLLSMDQIKAIPDYAGPSARVDMAAPDPASGRK